MKQYENTVAYQDIIGSNTLNYDLHDLNGKLLFKWGDVPKVPFIDQAIWQQISKKPKQLDMLSWHSDSTGLDLHADELISKCVTKNKTCGTKHCRAGWAILLGGKKGLKLELLVGAEAAGALIYAKSRPDYHIPDFHDSNLAAWEDIKKCAARDRKRMAKAAKK